MNREQVLENILQCKIIAIVRGFKTEEILKIAQSLQSGGISCIEVTFDHKEPDGIKQTLVSLQALKKLFGETLTIGAGTVLDPHEVKMAAEAGAEYIISPDTCEEVISSTRKLGKVSIPGAFTPTEALRAHAAGADIIKLFPACLLGASYIKALREPLGHLQFSAVGGITENNAAEFIQAGAVCIGVGGNLISEKMVRSQDFCGLTQMAKKYTNALGIL